MKELYVVGIGPGSYEDMTIRADRILSCSDVIVGYSVYVDLVRVNYPDKVYISTPMTKEIDRCRAAFEEALKGKVVSVVCSGDSSIYGMAGLMYQLLEQYPEVKLVVVPGITAAISGGAVLGSPLTHDFSVISLSDLLTPIETIWQRIRSASEADMTICIYNPSSKKRHDYLKKACEIMLEYKAPETVCGYVRNIGREGEQVVTLTLDELKNTEVDMYTTVFVGNKDTGVINGKMVTPRGYNIT